MPLRWEVLHVLLHEYVHECFEQEVHRTSVQCLIAYAKCPCVLKYE